MDTKTITAKVSALWEEYCEIYPELIRFDPPKIVLCNRLMVTMGKCYFWKNRIHLANKFFKNNAKLMLNEVLPHELAHQIHYNLYGMESAQNSVHGTEWMEIMLSMGKFPHVVYVADI